MYAFVFEQFPVSLLLSLAFPCPGPLYVTTDLALKGSQALALNYGASALSGTIPAIMRDFVRLTSFIAQNNKLSGPIPDDWFESDPLGYVLILKRTF